MPNHVSWHRVVIHADHFVDQITRVHTQEAELAWAILKGPIKQRRGNSQGRSPNIFGDLQIYISSNVSAVIISIYFGKIKWLLLLLLLLDERMWRQWRGLNNIRANFLPGLALKYTEYGVQKLNLTTFPRYVMFWTNIEWLKIIHSWSSDHCERLLEVLKIEQTLRGNEEDLPTFLNLTFEEVRIHGTALKYEGNLRRSFSETAITNVCCCFLDCMSTLKCTMYSLRVINSSVKLLRVPLFNLLHRCSYFGSFKKIKQVLKQLSSFSGVSKEYY